MLRQVLREWTREHKLKRESGLRFFYQDMSVWIGAGEDAEAEYVGYDERGFASAIHAIIGELVRGQALRVKVAKAGFIAEKWAAGHSHAPREQSFDRRIEPDDRDALHAQKIRCASLSVGSAAESEHRRFTQFE